MSGSALPALLLLFDEEADVFAAAADDSGDVDLFLTCVDGFDDGDAFGGGSSPAVGGGLLEAPHRGGVVGHGADDATSVGQMTMLVTADQPLTLPTFTAKIIGMSTTVVIHTEQATCTDFSCLNALSDASLCDCHGCYGADHGHAWKPVRKAAQDRIADRVKTTGDLGASAVSRRDDAADAAMGATTIRRSIDFCDVCFDIASDCTCED